MSAVRKTDEKDEMWVSLSTAGVMLGKSRPTVLKYAVKGDLVAQHIANRTVVSRESITRFLASRKK